VAGALAALAEELSAANLIEVKLDLAPTVELDADRATQLMHLARETLSNVARHAGATLVTIELSATGGALALRIADNGHGFDAGQIPTRGHRGLTNMRGRAESLGGTLEIESSAEGTVVTFRLPLAETPLAETPSAAT